MSLILRFQSPPALFSFLLAARLAKKSEHVLLVALHARLVERIHAGYVAADAAGKLEEVEQLSQIKLILLRNVYPEIGNTAVGVCQDSAVHGTLVDEIHSLSGQIVQSVQIYRLLTDGQLYS